MAFDVAPVTSDGVLATSDVAPVTSDVALEFFDAAPLTFDVAQVTSDVVLTTSDVVLESSDKVLETYCVLPYPAVHGMTKLACMDAYNHDRMHSGKIVSLGETLECSQ